MTKDPFAPREHGDLLKARCTPLTLRKLREVVLRAADVVMGMPEDDNRRLYAGEYLGHMQEMLDTRTEVRDLELAAGNTYDDNARLGDTYLYASALMRNRYGSATPLPTDANLRDDFDPIRAMWAQEGMTAVDSVLTEQIIGPPPETA